ncbi:MAG TPA: hypothetical protein VK787_07925 [Puia sp.]|jgi:hypothetical protein|nr:hypothetical protein [Puia sp.]
MERGKTISANYENKNNFHNGRQFTNRCFNLVMKTIRTLYYELSSEKHKKFLTDQSMSKSLGLLTNNLNLVSVETRAKSKARENLNPTLWTKILPLKNQSKSKNPTACANHPNPVSVENRPKFKAQENLNRTLWTKIVSFKNQLKSKDPKTRNPQNHFLSLENRPMSENLKTVS